MFYTFEKVEGNSAKDSQKRLLLKWQFSDIRNVELSPLEFKYDLFTPFINAYKNKHNLKNV